MNNEERERLVRLEERQIKHEERLVELKTDVADARDHNDQRIDELKELLLRQSLAEKVLFGIGGFIDRNWKTIVLVVITSGGAAAVQALTS